MGQIYLFETILKMIVDHINLLAHNALILQLDKGARSVMVIVVGNGHGDTSSNPGRD